MADDLGKPNDEAWLTEIGYLHRDIQHTKKHLKRWMKPRKVNSSILTWPSQSYIVAEPKGVILILGAWNYPVQLFLSPIIAAIAAGNCVIGKPSELAPATAKLFAESLKAYLPKEVMQVLNGGKELAVELTQQSFDHIFYTGGDQAGKAVMQAASRHLTPVTLELGGKSPAFVAADADLKITARRIVWGKFLNAGQTCIAPDYVLVERSVHDKLVEFLTQEISILFGPDVRNSNDYGRIVNDHHWQRLHELMCHGKIAYGGQTDATNRFIAPTLITHVDLDSPLMANEIFGPLLPIIAVNHYAAAREFIRSKPKPLALYTFTNNRSLQKRISDELSAGSICFNDTLVFMLNPELPFGGVGNSGMGRYHGRFGFLNLSHEKPVMQRSFRFDMKFRYPPYTSLKRNLMRWLTLGKY